jgi:hypothetical protein
MDLIGVGFTRNQNVKCRIDLIDLAIDGIPDETLRDEAFLNAIDPAGILDRAGDPEHVDFTDFVRETLKNGAREYDSAVSGHRMSTDFYIQGTPLEFVWAGGGSWGDDPFDGFSDLCVFINFCPSDDGVRELAGYVCGGLPGAALVALYADEGL